MLERLASAPQAPDTVRALARVLTRVLAGERDPDLSQLPDDLAGPVRDLLGRLRDD